MRCVFSPTNRDKSDVSALLRDFGYINVNYLFVLNRANFRALRFAAHDVNHQPDSK